MKTPRGSKLDATIRAEYESAVSQSEAWDTSGWPSWTVTGRVLPERCDVYIQRTASQGIGAGGKFRLTLEVTRSLIVAVCALEKATPTVFEIADVVRSALAFPVDYIAFRNRGAYEVILDLCIDNRTSEVWVIP